MVNAIGDFMTNHLGLDVKITPRIRDNRLIGYDLLSSAESGRMFYNWLYRNNLHIGMESKFLRKFNVTR